MTTATNLACRVMAELGLRRAFGAFVTVGAGSLAGFFGVLIGTHLYTPAALGFASVALAGASFVNVVANVGLVPTVLRRLARADAPGGLLSAAYTIGGATTLLVGAVYSIFLPLGSSGGHVGAALLAHVAFIALSVGMFFHSVQDSALFALDLSGRAAIRTIATQICRLGLIITLAHITDAGLVVAAAASYLVVTAWVQRRVLGPRVGAFRFSVSAWTTLLDRDLSYLSASYILDVLHWLPAAVLPVLIGRYLSMQAAGMYYVAFLVLGVATLPLTAIVTGEIAGQSAVRDVSTVERKTLLLALGAGLVACMGMEGGAPLLLRVFGGAYQVHATILLRLLALTVIPGSFRQIYVTRARLQLRMRPAVVVLTVSTVSVLLLSWLLIPISGLPGVGIAACLAEWAGAGLAAALWWGAARHGIELPGDRVAGDLPLAHPDYGDAAAERTA